MTRTPERSRPAISVAFMSSVTNEFEIGHVVRPSPRSRTTSTSAGSSTTFVPWSTRSTPISSSTVRMLSMLPTWSMSQCIVSRYPSSQARANTSANFCGGLSRSSESSPTPRILSRNGTDASSVSAALCAEWSRRKHRMRCASMPCLFGASAAARWYPVTTASNGTPRDVCACGSKNISACFTPSAAARAR
ncbi:Uncharacterised protein [Mycobacteroides abscessus]|nr:Uncharacterised protein [Mycobacteroides abscessus]